jgi:hypothetical protein
MVLFGGKFRFTVLGAVSTLAAWLYRTQLVPSGLRFPPSRVSSLLLLNF